MRINNTYLLIKLVFIYSVMMLVGCSSLDHYDATSSEFSGGENTNVLPRDVIKTVSMNIEVEEPYEASREVENMIIKYAGFVESSHSYSQETINLVAKIPVENLDSFVRKVSNMGTLISKTMTIKDVTKDLVDIKAKLSNLYSLRERYRFLLGKAKGINEILKMEKELTRIQTKIDMIQGRKKALNYKTTYSSVDIRIDQEIMYGPITYGFKALYWLVEKLFVI